MTERVRFRFLASVRKGRIPDALSQASQSPDDLPYLSMEYLRGETDTPAYCSPSSSHVVARPNDLLLLWDGSNAGEFLRAKEGVVSSTAALVTPRNVSGRFLFWTCKSSQSMLQSDTVGMGIPHVNGDVLADLRLPLPPLAEQERIADYLDAETARMDALVAEKERMLALLEEKRAALVSHAVTRGLNPDAPTKPSGLDWLGDIPAHWQVRRLKHCAVELQTGPFGSQLHAEDYSDEGIPVINPADIVQYSISDAKAARVDPDIAEQLSRHKMMDGDVVFARRGELGRCARVTITQEGWLCGTGSLRARLRAELLDPDLLVVLMANTVLPALLSLESVGSTMENLNTEILGELKLPIPPPDEQAAILAHLSEERARTAELEEALRASIALLKERRAALIAAAVTGQVELGEQT